MNTAHGRLSLFDGVAELLGKRQFEAAKPNRLRTVKRSRTSIDADTRRGAKPVREAARWLDQNYDLATGALDVLVRNVVGTGILPDPLVRTRDGDLATDFNAELSEWFALWANEPEVTGELDYAATQRLKALTLFRDGEVFTQYLLGKVPGLRHGTEVPFSIELIDPDQVPLGVSDPRRGIVQGIGKDDWGRPNLYLVAKPDTLGVGSSILTSGDYREIPAARIQHLKPIRRIRQTRGMSAFVSAIERLEDIRSYDESERVAAVIAASLAAYIKRGSPDFYDPKNAAQKRFDADGNLIPREHKLRAGMIFDFLEIGEEIGTIDTNRPNPNLGRFRDDQLRAGSAGIGVSFSSMGRNYEGNYSSRRQEANEMAPQYAILWDYFCSRGERPTWVHLVDMLVASGRITVTRDIDPATLHQVSYSRPPTPAIDREKENRADSEALETFQLTLEDIWRREGKRPADMWRKLADQKKRLEALEGAAPRRALAAPNPDEAKKKDNDDESEDEKEEAA